MSAKTQQITLSVEELSSVLETLIRKVVREEIEHMMNVFFLESDSPLYKDLENILERKSKGKMRLHSHEVVWA